MSLHQHLEPGTKISWGGDAHRPPLTATITRREIYEDRVLYEAEDVHGISFGVFASEILDVLS